MDSAIPVSYTHLDVYKRQPLTMAASGAVEMFGLFENYRPNCPVHIFNTSSINFEHTDNQLLYRKNIFSNESYMV